MKELSKRIGEDENQQQFLLCLESSPSLMPSRFLGLSLFNLCHRFGGMNDWHALKKVIFSKEGRKCWICGSADGRLVLHESWFYNKKTKRTKLVSVHHLCYLCHLIKHINLFDNIDAHPDLIKKGITRLFVIRHFCKVNRCTKKDFQLHYEKFCESLLSDIIRGLQGKTIIQRKYSAKFWRVDYGCFQKYAVKSLRAYIKWDKKRWQRGNEFTIFHHI